MKDNENQKALYGLYDVRGNIILTGMFWDGDSANIIFEQEDKKYMRISSCENFEAFTETVFIDNYEDYAPYIDKINARYGTCFDAQKRQLYLRFRRNEMTITEAVTKLHGAMMLIASLHWHLFV